VAGNLKLCSGIGKGGSIMSGSGAGAPSVPAAGYASGWHRPPRSCHSSSANAEHGNPGRASGTCSAHRGKPGRASGHRRHATRGKPRRTSARRVARGKLRRTSARRVACGKPGRASGRSRRATRGKPRRTSGRARLVACGSAHRKFGWAAGMGDSSRCAGWGTGQSAV
jgi:hypothetical protein